MKNFLGKLTLQYVFEKIKALFDNFIPPSDDTKMNSNNPVGAGSFSMNRKPDSTRGAYSVAVGYQTTASGYHTHAEGSETIASGSVSHAEGYRTKASGMYSHAEGSSTVASGIVSHAEGGNTIAQGKYSHVSGQYNIADTEDKYAEIIGGGTSDSDRKNIRTLDWEGNAEYAGNVTDGNGHTITDAYQLAQITGDAKIDKADGRGTGSFFVGTNEGTQTVADNCFGFGKNLNIGGTYNTAFGQNNTVYGSNNIIGGTWNVLSGVSNFASGTNNTLRSSQYNFCQGQNNTIDPGTDTAYNNAIFGANNVSRKSYILMTGRNNEAKSARTSVLGCYCIANGWTQHVFGQYNIEDPRETEGIYNDYGELGDFVEIVGNGYSKSGVVTRSNARTLDWKGNEWVAGDFTNGNGETLSDAHAKIAELTARIEALEALLASQS